MSRPVKTRAESGFTLPEVLIAIVIEAIIVGALGMAFIGIMKSSTQVNQSLSRSGDARIAAAYIISDARNSSGPEVKVPPATATCTNPSPPVAGGSMVVQFGWSTTDLSGNSTNSVVAYILASNKLMRRVCTNGSTVASSDTVIAQNVQSVAITCLPTAVPQCSGTPTSLTATITATADAIGGTPYTYSLTGTFRKLIGGGVIPSTPSNPQSVVLLGASGTCSGTTDTINISGSASMRVYGAAFINTANGANCNAMELSNSGTWQAGSTNIFTGGSCLSPGAWLPCPTVNTFSPRVTDPYASLTAPSTSGLPIRTGCSGAQATQTASPGYYSTGFNLGGGNTCTLASGVYVVAGGFNVSNGATLKTGAGGVLIYLMSGQFAISGGANVTFTAMTSGSYSGLVLWQAAANTQPISFSNGGALVFNGAIYGPTAQLQISGNAQTPTVTALVIQTINLSNSGGITVGTPPATPLSIPTPATLGPWTVNRPFTTTINAAGGDGNYVWSATGLPATLSINASTGVISGTPTATGSSSVTVKLNDQLGTPQVTKSYTLVVNPAPTITTASLPQAEKTAPYNATVVGANGTTPYSWSAPGLPAGLSMNSSTGAITGSPTGATGTSSVSITLADNSGASVSKNLSITVINGPTITATTLTNGTTGTTYSKTFAATGGTTAYSWSATGLPAGMSMSTAGVISGSPTASGSYTVNVTVEDAVDGTDTDTLSLTIQPKIVSVALTNKASGGTAGKMEVGDKITIVYSDTMKVSGFCSSWSNDGNNQSLTGNNLQVNVSNGTTDAITVTNTSGTGCTTFNLGTIDLASNGYVTAAAVFGGSGGNTTIAWTASTKTLVITLGALKSGTVGTVNGNTSPIYTASASITDTGNRALGNSPFTVTPAAKRF